MPPRTALAVATAMLLLPGLANAAQPPDSAGILTLQGENASITTGNPTDRLYTNGLRLEWTSPAGQVPDVLANFGRALWGAGQQRIGIGLSQQIYTPIDTDAVPANPHDRPYAGYLTTNLSLLSDTPTYQTTMTLSLGVVGPASGAENLQDSFHNLIGQAHPHGWASQIPNTFAFELLGDRTWRLPLASFGGLETDLLPDVTVGVGDMRDYVQAGATFRIGQGLNSDFGVPRIRPGLSGGDVYRPTRPFVWYLFAGVDGQAVGYDLLLQSSPFRSGPHVNPVWDVGEVQAGAAFIAYGMRLTLAWVAQTQEFEGQGGGLHQFGSASIGVRF